MGLGAPSRRHFVTSVTSRVWSSLGADGTGASASAQACCVVGGGCGGPAGKRLTSRPRLSCLGPGSFRHGRLCLQTLHQPLREPGEPGPLQHLEPGPRVSAGPRACAQAQSAPRPARPGPAPPCRARGSWSQRRRRRAVWTGLPTGLGVIQRCGPRRELARARPRL